MDLNDLLNIDPSKKSLKFLYDRILRDDYRGIQISQHNRYTYNQIVDMLRILYEKVGINKLTIRTADLKKRPFNTPEESLYAEYVNSINKIYGKGTQDSIRKNLFVDLHRMGLIIRYDEKSNEIGPFDSGTKKFVSLSKLGLDLINEREKLKKYLIFTKSIDKLLKGMATLLFDLLSELDKITEDEYTYFVSFLYFDYKGKQILKDDIINYVKEYRALSKYQKEQVSFVVKTFCNPENFNGNKTQKRDFHNWKNETQQVFTLLSMTAYYEYDKANNVINFRITKDGLFQNDSKLKRSLVEKKQYFEKHKVSKTIGFELHHIIPLSWAKTKDEFFLLDKWDNMIYIDGYTHATITQENSEHVLLNIDDETSDLILSNYKNATVTCIYEKNVKYSKDLKLILKNKNTELLSLK